MSDTNIHAPEAEEINLKELQAALGRRWPFILACVTLGGLAAAWTTSRSKPTWQGSFEIVVANQNQGSGIGSILGSNTMLSSLAILGGRGGNTSELLTDVKILQSASVLRPVFQEVSARKTALGENTDGQDFKAWASNLTIKVQDETSVLTVSYRDNNKSLILPVLRSLSEAYQNYSTQERDESLKNAIKFAEQQARIYRQRSDASSRKLNSYGLTYGIASSNNLGVAGGGFDISKLILPTQSNGSLLNLGGGTSSANKSNGGDPLGQLAELNQELIRRQQTFTTKDPSVIALVKERDAVRRYMESSAFGSISYPGKQNLSKEQAQSVLLRHQELERKANRDKSTLDSMESALLSLQLELARAGTPWQVISPPTLLEHPVAPRPMRNLAFGIALGTTLGCAAALIIDKLSGLVFNKEDFLRLLPNQLLLELPSNQAHTWHDSLRLLGLGNAQGGSIAMLPLGDIKISHINRVRDILMETCNTNIEICRTSLEAAKFDKQLLLTAPGSIKKSHLDRLIQELGLQQTPIIGWIWFK